MLFTRRGRRYGAGEGGGFGIAKAAAAAGGDLTASGTVLGTPKYLAQNRSRAMSPTLGPIFTQWALCCSRCSLARHQSKATTDMATALAHVEQPAPHLDRLRPGLPPGGLGIWSMHCWLRIPDKRVPSALVLGGALTAISRSMGLPAQSEPGAYLHIGLGALSPATPAALAGGAGSWSSEGLSPEQAQATNVEATNVQAANVQAANVQDGQSEDALGQRAAGGTLALAEKGSPEGAPSHRDNSAKSPRKRRKEGFRRRPGPVTTVIVGSLLAAGALAALALWRADSPAGPTSRSTSSSQLNLAHPNSYSPLTVVAVSELAQNGNHANDNVSQLGNVIDGNPATSWEGDVYDSPNFGGSGGFGLVLKLGSRHALHELVVTTAMQGWSAETFTSNVDAPTLSGWGTATSTRSPINGNATFSLADKPASWVLLWMTNPAPPVKPRSKSSPSVSYSGAYGSYVSVVLLWLAKPVPGQTGAGPNLCRQSRAG